MSGPRYARWLEERAKITGFSPPAQEAFQELLGPTGLGPCDRPKAPASVSPSLRRSPHDAPAGSLGESGEEGLGVEG